MSILVLTNKLLLIPERGCCSFLTRLCYRTNRRLAALDAALQLLAAGPRGPCAVCSPSCLASFVMIPTTMIDHTVMLDSSSTQRGMLQARYHDSLTVLLAALAEHCGGLAEWTPPRAGMFLWLRATAVADARELMDELVALKVRAHAAGSTRPQVSLDAVRHGSAP